ncbi:MAG: pilus assembly protein [Anaerolineae bacterium]|nr:pilus assembly protein [Anaerolineae bacterium]
MSDLGEVRKRRRRCWGDGQSIVEFALVLPLLLLFFIGMTEIGFAMYSYIRVAGANREGARMASRGRFSDDTVFRQVVAAGGLREVGGGTEPNLRTTGLDTNTGIIITHVDITVETGDIDTRTSVSGTLTLIDDGEPETRWILPADSKLNQLTHDEWLALKDKWTSVSRDIVDYRDQEEFEVLDVETFVIVETFYSHETLTDFLPFLNERMQLYFESTMRVMEDSRLD